MWLNEGWLMRRKNPVFLSCLMLVTLFINGCAMSSMFSPYPQQIAVVKQQIEHKKFAESLQLLDKKRGSRDEVLYLLERARVAQLSGDFSTSISDFRTAIQDVEKVDEQAKISFSKSVSKSAALLSSDNAIPYEASSYERVLLHHYQALNFIAQKNWEAASVEVRRAALEQKEAVERHHKELAKAEEKAREEKFDPSSSQSQVNKHYKSMYDAASSVKNSFQNAYTFYFSGVVWEILNEKNDAYIDYKKALEIFPANHFLQDDVLRLAKQLGFREDYDLYEKQFARQAAPSTSADEGEIVVIYEEGFVPVKDSTVLSLPISKGIHSVSFPFYRDVALNARQLKLYDGAKVIGATEMILDLRALVIKDLQEKMPGIMIRQVLRLLAKDRLQQTAKDKLGDAGRFAAMLYNVVSEQADRRSWLTLPRDVQIFRSKLAAGTHELGLVAGNGRRENISVNIRQRQITIVYVVATGSQLLVQLL